MKNSYYIIFLIFSMSLISCSYDMQQYPSSWKLKIGDEKHWAEKDFNDYHWENQRGVADTTVFWIRYKITFDSKVTSIKPLGMEVISLGSCEIFIDGILIGENGAVGKTKAEETPGKMTSFLLIPDSLATEGEHIVALRMSNFNLPNNNSFGYFLVGNYFQMVRIPLITTAFMYILAGVFLVVAIYYFFLYLNKNRELSILIFSVTCLILFLLIIIEYIKFYWLYTYDYHYIRLEIISWLTFAIASLIPLFFAYQFSFPYKRYFFGCLELILVFIYLFFYGRHDAAAEYTSLVMWSASVLVVGYSSFRKVNGSYIAFAGIIISAALAYFLTYDISLFISFGIIIIFMLYLLAIKIKDQKIAYENTLLLSARLKTELLKKNIQPHFLMNTLTSLIEWVEESPKDGIAFIEALAEEFEILNQIADAQLIPISQEINLCKSHLKVMGYRKEIQYLWKDNGIDINVCIPPAIIHTALENGITHNLPLEDGSIIFSLNYEVTEKYKMYKLQTIAKQRPPSNLKRIGTGNKYIKARLTESYGTKWEFNSETNAQGWLTSIKIFS